MVGELWGRRLVWRHSGSRCPAGGRSLFPRRPKDMGFTEYALIEQTDEGLLIKPLKVEDERISLDVLRRLIVEGCEGEALVGC